MFSIMTLEQTLDLTLKQAMKNKDGPTTDVVRMLKTKLQERRTAKGFAGAVDDALVLDVIGAYRKQLQKAIAEYEKIGERGAGQAAQLRFELEFCERYLPKGMDETAVRALVKERLAALGITDAKQAGRLVGDIMKTHKGQVEAGEVKRLGEELLAGGGLASGGAGNRSWSGCSTCRARHHGTRRRRGRWSHLRCPHRGNCPGRSGPTPRYCHARHRRPRSSAGKIRHYPTGPRSPPTPSFRCPS